MDIVLAVRLTVDCWLLPVTALVALISTLSVPSVYILSRFTFHLVQYISVVISRAILGLCGGSSSLLSTSETLLDTCTTMRNWRSASLVTRASAEWNGSGSPWNDGATSCAWSSVLMTRHCCALEAIDGWFPVRLLMVCAVWLATGGWPSPPNAF